MSKQLGKCIRCDNPIMSVGGDLEGNPNDAMEGVIRGHYGSRNDGSEFLAWICDDCVPSVTDSCKGYLFDSDEHKPSTRAEYIAYVAAGWDENGNPRAEAIA